MTRTRPFRFALKVRTTPDGKALAEAARRAERLGYDALLVSDHPTHPQLGPIATATALACATTEARVGSSVVANDFRHPVLPRARLPIMLGGGGRRFLSLAGQKADIIGINPAARSGAHDVATDTDAKAETTDEKLRWVREAAGARLEEIEIAMQVYAGRVTNDRAEGDRVLEARYPFSIEDARRVPYAWVGSVDHICDALEERRERWGVSYWVVMAEGMEEMAPIVDRLAGR